MLPYIDYVCTQILPLVQHLTYISISAFHSEGGARGNGEVEVRQPPADIELFPAACPGKVLLPEETLCSAPTAVRNGTEETDQPQPPRTSVLGEPQGRAGRPGHAVS